MLAVNVILQMFLFLLVIWTECCMHPFLVEASVEHCCMGSTLISQFRFADGECEDAYCINFVVCFRFS